MHYKISSVKSIANNTIVEFDQCVPLNVHLQVKVNGYSRELISIPSGNPRNFGLMIYVEGNVNVKIDDEIELFGV